MILLCLSGTEALHSYHIENNRMVDDAIDRSECGHRVFEDAVAGRKHQVGGNHHRTLLIALGQQRKEDLYFVAILVG